MIALLRAGALLVNGVVAAGVPLALGLHWSAATAVTLAFFAGSWWGCGRMPSSREADAEMHDAGMRAARAMNAPLPRSVRALPGWTAGAVRVRGGYVLILGDAVEPSHREAVLAHEIAHVVTGDLAWEPFTDGPARLLLPAVRRFPPFGIAVFPFFLFAVPLAKRTELRADRLAADAVASYPALLQQVAAKLGPGGSILYPSLRERIRYSAQDSLADS